MSTQYIPLSIVELGKSAVLAQPRNLPELVYIDDPGIYVMVDLQYHEYITVAANDTIDHITQELQATNHHDGLVLAAEEVVGIISIRDLRGTKPTQISQEKRIGRHEMTAAMLMTPCQAIIILDYEQLLKTRVGNVVVTLNNHKKSYALVVENDKKYQQQTIRGFISSVKIAQQLGEDISKLS